MDGDGQLFDTESLSFDSTLESLLEADFLLDDKDTYIPPTEAELSTQVNHGVDIRLSECGTQGETTKTVDLEITKIPIESGANGKANEKVEKEISPWPSGSKINGETMESVDADISELQSESGVVQQTIENVVRESVWPSGSEINGETTEIVEVENSESQSGSGVNDKTIENVAKEISVLPRESEINGETTEIVDAENSEHQIGSGVIDKKIENFAKEISVLPRETEINGETMEIVDAENSALLIGSGVNETVQNVVKEISVWPSENETNVGSTETATLEMSSLPGECGPNLETAENPGEDNSTVKLGEHMEEINKDIEHIVGEANVLSDTETNSESSNIQISNDTETTHQESIASLNFQEIKAKRMRKIEEIETVKAPEYEQIQNDEVKCNRNDNLNLKGHIQLNCNGKRKRDDSTEDIKDKSNKQHKGDENCLEKVDIDIQNSQINSDLLSDNSNLEAHKINEDKNMFNDTSEVSNSNSSLENPNSTIDSQIKYLPSSDNVANESTDDTLTEDIMPMIEPEELINLADDDDEVDYDQLEITGPPGENDENGEIDENDVELNSADEGSDLDENEIDAWLDEGLVKKETNENADKEDDVDDETLKQGEFTTAEKLILEEKGNSPFEVLPPGWVQVTHISGMLVYLHKESRVCSMSKPYNLGSLSVRRHEIPLSAIPCLKYKRALEKEQKEEEQKKNGEQKSQEGEPDNSQEEANKNIRDENTKNLPTAVLQNLEQTTLLGENEVYDYCKKLFKFRSIIVKKFRTWKEKRKHLVSNRKKKKLPGLHNTKLITCAFPPDSKVKKKKNFAINPVGKSPVCILHEYTQHALGHQPAYSYKEIENSETPFKATVLINGIQYGAGVASGKRQAKAEAAKKALEIFMPQLTEQIKAASGKQEESHTDLKYFEEVDIDDPRVMDLCDKAALPKPFCVLIECLRRNFGLGDTNLVVDKKQISNQKTEFSLKVGKHTATVISRNKREGKQRAAQVMLKLLHPNLKNWASILRLYSKESELGFKEREDDANAKLLHSKQKNFEILDKLKEAMLKVRAQRDEQRKSSSAAELQIVTQPLDL